MLRAESPSPSPVPSPTPLSDEDINGEVDQQDLNDYIHLVQQDVIPSGTFIAIHQDMTRGPQDRWYIVTRGREVGIFNSW